MSSRSYRLQNDNGLSDELTPQLLREKSERGEIDGAAQCTPDDGKTWVNVSSLIAENSDLLDSTESLVAEERDSGASADDTTIRANSATVADGFGGSRKLKRLPVGSRKSLNKKIAKRAKPINADEKSGLSHLVGKVLPGGRYKVLSQFGSGSMAYVFRASDNRLETDVVIKVPKPEKITSDDFRERFRRESQLLVRLSHPHVVKVLDVGEFDDLPYVVMQLLSGGTLLDLVKNDSNKLNQMSPESLKLWVREVARALDFCFKKGMVHRDVKPANILFDDDKNAYVSDFGLTKIMHGEHTELCSDGTANGVVLGTPNYLPPEIILGAKYDGRADQYSLAMTVYHALCGRPPMQGKSATATMINQTQKKLELLSSFRPDIPVELALVVQKGIEKNPKNRFENCEAFADALLNGLKSDSSSSSRVSSAQAVGLTASVDSGEWHEDSAASSPRSSARRRPKKKKPTKKRQSSSASSASRSTEDWLEPAPEKLPPKRGARSRTRLKKKPPNDGQIVLFGQKVHPAVVAISAFAMLLPTALFLIYSRGSETVSEPEIDVVQSLTDRTNEALVARQGEIDSKASPAVDFLDESGDSESNRLVQPEESNGSETQPSETPVRDSTRVAMNDGYGSVMSDSVLLGSAPESTDSSNALTDGMAGSADFEPLAEPRIVLSSLPNGAVTHGPPNCPVIVVGSSVWSIADRRSSVELEGEYDSNALTALSSDGRYFCAASKPPGQQNTDVVVWNTETGKKQFTASGDSKRFVDSILISSARLFVGDRWSDELLVWDCESGDKKQAVKIHQARFKQGNTAISHDGEYIAAVAGNQLGVFRASEGKGVVALGLPRSVSRDAAKAEALYASLQSLSFSPNNTEIATVATANGVRLLCWNGQGELVVERALSRSLVDTPFVQWFANRNSLLIGTDVFDRATERVVVIVSGSNPETPLSIFDDSSLCGRFASSPSEVTLREIPWNEISRSLLAMRNDRKSAIRPDIGVSVNLQLTGSKGRHDSEFRKALRARIASCGLSTSENSQTLLTLRITSADEKFVPNVANKFVSDLASMELPKAVDGSLVVAELTEPGTSQPIWSISLGKAPALANGDGPSQPETQESVSALIAKIEALPIPYYIPDSKELFALPVVLQ